MAAGLRGGGLRAVVVGDCLASLGTLAGLQRAGHDPSIVWFDAHGDIHTIASSTSQYLGGMPLRMMIGGDPDRLTGPLGIRTLAEDRAVLVDARDLDPGEVEFLATSRVRRSSVDELTAADLPPGPVLVHIDLDVIDAAEVPGMRFPVGRRPQLGCGPRGGRPPLRHRPGRVAQPLLPVVPNRRRAARLASGRP